MSANCDIFLNAYRDLEEVLATRYGQRSGLVQMYAAGEGQRFSEELTLFREMRNLLSHHGKIKGEFCVLPSDQAVKKMLEILEYAKNPPVAMSMATPAKSLCFAHMSSPVSEVIETMEKRGYSHIPILDGKGALFGVFSVGTLFSFVKANPERNTGGLFIRDLKDYIPPEKHTTEKFAFTNRDASLLDIKNLFKPSGPSHRKAVAVFVTSDGTKNGKLLGMITPWDVFKTENNT